MKKIIAILSLFLGPVVYFADAYMNAEEQYKTFENISKEQSKVQVLKLFGEPLEYIRHSENVFWGEVTTLTKNDGSCIDGYSFDTYDSFFHPQRYLFCFDSKNRVVSKLVLRAEGEASFYRDILKAIGFEPS